MNRLSIVDLRAAQQLINDVRRPKMRMLNEAECLYVRVVCLLIERVVATEGL